MNRQNNRALLILTLALAVIAGLLMFNLAKRPKPQSSAAISTEQLIRPDSPFLAC
ncbi:hypothetical protein [Deinococcus radiophilus]|uniref:hypothetical protein n=1 Tax=Deinococcus radiophilus TaxID=32062 RepID=UPI00362104A5